MYLAYTPEQEALRQQVREYFARIVTPEVEEAMAQGEMGGPLLRGVIRRMGEDGWLGIGWPKEYGGQGRGAIEQFIFFDEAWRAGAPIPFLTVNSVGPAIMRFGTEEQKREYLPRILRGEIQFAIGYSEPNAGTDLASLQTRAELVGDEWVINGAKVFTSIAEDADYVWLAARTDPEAPKHKGISIFIVPTDAPGFRVTPIWTMGDARTNATYYEDVRIPKGNLVGELNRGWDVIVNQLNHERIALCPPGMVTRVYEQVRRWAQETKVADGRRLIDQEWVRLNLARVHAKLEFLRLINWKAAWEIDRGVVDPTNSSATKVFGTEFFIEAYRLLMEVAGQTSYLKRGSADAVLSGRLERAYRGTTILTFGGGTNEIQRDIIAIFGLGMPRPMR